jgi:DNA-directed RNA polymerase beta subunit
MIHDGSTIEDGCVISKTLQQAGVGARYEQTVFTETLFLKKQNANLNRSNTYPPKQTPVENEGTYTLEYLVPENTTAQPERGASAAQKLHDHAINPNTNLPYNGSVLGPGDTVFRLCRDTHTHNKPTQYSYKRFQLPNGTGISTQIMNVAISKKGSQVQLMIALTYTFELEEGDKMSTQASGQKTTVTGFIANGDRPWTGAGLNIDIIPNSHSVPSRKTVSRWIQTLLGKVVCEHPGLILQSTGRPIGEVFTFDEQAHTGVGGSLPIDPPTVEVAALSRTIEQVSQARNDARVLTALWMKIQDRQQTTFATGWFALSQATATVGSGANENMDLQTKLQRAFLAAILVGLKVIKRLCVPLHLDIHHQNNPQHNSVPSGPARHHHAQLPNLTTCRVNTEAIRRVLTSMTSLLAQTAHLTEPQIQTLVKSVGLGMVMADLLRYHFMPSLCGIEENEQIINAVCTHYSSLVDERFGEKLCQLRKSAMEQKSTVTDILTRPEWETPTYHPYYLPPQGQATEHPIKCHNTHWLTATQKHILYKKSNEPVRILAEQLLMCGVRSPSTRLELLHPKYDSNPEKRHRLLYDLMRYTSDVIYDPLTGNKHSAVVLTGLCYVQFLDKFANQQYKLRASGAMDSKTRQPVHNKQTNGTGSTRIGHMEKDALIQAGAYAAIHDRYYMNSDMTYVWYCVKCRNNGFYDYRVNEPFCVKCQSPTHVKRVQTVFANIILSYLQRWQGQKVSWNVKAVDTGSIGLIKADVETRLT